MKRSLSHGSTIVLAVVSLTLQFPQVALSEDSTPKSKLTIMVYNYAALSSSQVKEIGAQVAFIFDNAGIPIKWLDCRPGPKDPQPPAICRQPLGPVNLAIRLFDQAATPKTGSFVTPLAHSFGSETGGSYATVFRATVKQFARGDQNAEITLLGHAIAHEIGHLLLGYGAHSSAGIMKAQWNKGELLQIAQAQRGLLFTKEQAKRLKMSLIARHLEMQGNQKASLSRQ